MTRDARSTAWQTAMRTRRRYGASQLGADAVRVPVPRGRVRYRPASTLACPVPHWRRSLVAGLPRVLGAVGVLIFFGLLGCGMYGIVSALVAAWPPPDVLMTAPGPAAVDGGTDALMSFALHAVMPLTVFLTVITVAIRMFFGRY